MKIQILTLFYFFTTHTICAQENKLKLLNVPVGNFSFKEQAHKSSNNFSIKMLENEFFTSTPLINFNNKTDKTCSYIKPLFNMIDIINSKVYDFNAPELSMLSKSWNLQLNVGKGCK